jgi:hypothetical protein
MYESEMPQFCILPAFSCVFHRAVNSVSQIAREGFVPFLWDLIQASIVIQEIPPFIYYYYSFKLQMGFYPVTHYFSENLVQPRIEPGTSGSVARNSDH